MSGTGPCSFEAILLTRQPREDCYHLSCALPNLSSREDFERNIAALGAISDIFRPFAESRQPRTSVLVKGARALGERRVAVGAERGKERDEAIAQSFRGGAAAIVEKFEGLLSQPFN